MSIKLMAAIWDHGPKRQSDRFVLLCLCDHAGDDGKCWPSVARVARKTCLSERGVQTILRRLEADGWLRIEVGGGRGGTNIYRINPAAGSPRSICTPQMDAETPQMDAINPAADAPEPLRTIKEPSVEPPLVPPKQKRATALPETWVPSDKNITDAEARGFSEKEIQDEADRFRDYHLAKGTTFKDWNAGWRTWLGNARKYAGNGRVVSGAFPGGRGQGGGLAGEVARRRLAGETPR